MTPPGLPERVLTRLRAILFTVQVQKREFRPPGEYFAESGAQSEATPSLDCRFAEVEYLEELGTGRTSFEVYLRRKLAREAIGFDHEFDPAAHVRAPIF